MEGVQYLASSVGIGPSLQQQLSHVHLAVL